MNVRSMLIGAALVVGTAMITTQVVSQDKKPGGQPPQMSPKEMEMMQKCVEAGTPGENHKLLAKKVGKWTGTGKFWMTPDAQPQENTVNCEIKGLYDGRYLSESIEGPGMGGEGTFLGSSWAGYDNVSKKFWWTWIDNMGTGKMDATGTYDAASKTFKYGTELNCPLAGKQVAGRCTEKWIDENHFVMEMYGPWYETNKEFKMMEITYTRAR